MAAKNLPKHLQKKGYFIRYGRGYYPALHHGLHRVLAVPGTFLKTLGAVLLVFIGIKLIGADDAEEDVHVEAKDSLWAAVRTIMMADALMSLDNVLGIVGVTNNHWGLLMFGMALFPFPIIRLLGRLLFVSEVMNRFPILVYIGGAILGWGIGRHGGQRSLFSPICRLGLCQSVGDEGHFAGRYRYRWLSLEGLS